MLPWQISNWQTLTSSHQNKLLAHGVLFTGPRGIGKQQFATAFAHWLICEQPQSDHACGTCRSCLLIKAGSHPDLLTITPEEEGKAIKVDQIRELIEKLSFTGHVQGARVIIISPADALNINASNSLLKTLEEPPANTYLILITDKPSKLMATIRSRTQIVRFDLPTESQSLEWLKQHKLQQADLLLKLSSGAPLAAFDLATDDALSLRDTYFKNWQELASGDADAIDIASNWSKDGLKINANRPLYWVYSWIMDMIRSLQGIHNSCMVNTDYVKVLQKLAGQVDLKSLYGLLDRLNESLRMMDSAANQQMLIEGLLLHWAGLKRSS
jgi:DNA polymerase-3 subunit delta'